MSEEHCLDLQQLLLRLFLDIGYVVADQRIVFEGQNFLLVMLVLLPALAQLAVELLCFLDQFLLGADAFQLGVVKLYLDFGQLAVGLIEIAGFGVGLLEL